MEDMLTTQEVADLCRTSLDTVRYWAWIGKGPHSLKVGRRRLYRRDDVKAWLEEQYQASADNTRVAVGA